MNYELSNRKQRVNAHRIVIASVFIPYQIRDKLRNLLKIATLRSYIARNDSERLQQRPFFGVITSPNLSFLRRGEKKGFGLMEVLLSGLIIIMILGALVSIGHAAVSNNEYAAQRTQAVYLAQEGIEMVRQIRDTNWIDGDNTTSWDSIFEAAGGNKPTKKIDYGTYLKCHGSLRQGKYGCVLKQCNNPACTDAADAADLTLAGITYHRVFKTLTTDLGVGALLPTDPTNATATDVHPDINAMKIKVVVTWNFHGQIKTVEASEILTNWRPDY